MPVSLYPANRWHNVPVHLSFSGHTEQDGISFEADPDTIRHAEVASKTLQRRRKSMPSIGRGGLSEVDSGGVLSRLDDSGYITMQSVTSSHKYFTVSSVIPQASLMLLS